MSRKLTSHIVNPANDKLLVEVLDEPGSGGANHLYAVTMPPSSTGSHQIEIAFQNGPIAEVGTNGLTNEAILAILIDRLQGFQSGQYKCRENAIALTHLEDAMLWLGKRTRDRMARGVEGAHTV